MSYMGDFVPGQIVYIYFNTFSSNDPAASVTMTDFVDTDVHIYRDDNLTQRNDTAGVAIDIDVDAIQIGTHFISIDTGNNTVADFFISGHDYFVVITGVTVDSGTLNAVVGSFSIDNRAGAGRMISTNINTLASQTSFTLDAGAPSDGAYINCLAVIRDITTLNQVCIGRVSAYTTAAKTITLAADPGIFTIAAGDNITIIAAGALVNVDAVGGTLQTANDMSGDIDILITQVGTAGAGLTNIDLPNQTMDITGNLSGSVGSVTGAVGSVAGNVDGSVASVTTILANLEAAGLVLMSATIETVTSQTALIIPATDDATDDDAYIGATAVIIDGTDPNQKSLRSVVDYAAGTRTVTIDVAADFTVTTSDTLILLPCASTKGVWDRILTGATHNISTSAGRRLRGIQEFQGYEDGAVWIDTVNGTAGTTNFENGTVERPVLSLADAITIASSLNLVRFHVFPGSTITFAEAHTNEVWMGEGWTLALGNRDISNTHITDADVTGIATTPTGQAHFVGCEIGTSTLGEAHLEGCSLTGTLTLSAAAAYLIEYCGSEGSTAWILDLGALVANTHVDIHGFNGEIDIRNAGANASTDTVHLFGIGIVTLNSNCVSGGTIDIHGQFDLTDNSSSAVSFDEVRTGVGTVGDAAAVGDPSTSESVMQYVKQLLNVIMGTTGIGTMPAAADPADGVNLFEVARRIFDDTNAIEPITTGLGQTAADRLALTMGASPNALVDTAGFTATTTEFESDGITTAAADHFIGRIVLFTTGTGDLDEQATDITDYALTGGRGHFTVTALTSAPADNAPFIII